MFIQLMVLTLVMIFVLCLVGQLIYTFTHRK